MAARMTVFCRRSVEKVTPDEMLKGIKLADLACIAEDYDLDYEVAHSFVRQLRVENTRDNGFTTFVIRFGELEADRCDVDRATETTGARTAVEDHLNNVRADSHPALAKIEQHCKDVIEVVSVRLPAHQNATMGYIIGSEAARWIAEVGDGLIEGADGMWWTLGKYREYSRLLP